MTKWTVTHKGDIITVEIDSGKGTLFVNEKEADSKNRVLYCNLYGKTTSGDEIKAVIDIGRKKEHCSIFVNKERILKE